MESKDSKRNATTTIEEYRDYDRLKAIAVLRVTEIKQFFSLEMDEDFGAYC